MIKDHHIDTCRELASLMEEKGVKWEWEVGDWLKSSWQPLPVAVEYPQQDIPGAIPIPTFTRCVEVLREWGYDGFKLVSPVSCGYNESNQQIWDTSRFIFSFEKRTWAMENPYQPLTLCNVYAQDPDHAGQLALVAAVKRMEKL